MVDGATKIRVHALLLSAIEGGGGGEEGWFWSRRHYAGFFCSSGTVTSLDRGSRKKVDNFSDACCKVENLITLFENSINKKIQESSCWRGWEIYKCLSITSASCQAHAPLFSTEMPDPSHQFCYDSIQVIVSHTHTHSLLTLWQHELIIFLEFRMRKPATRRYSFKKAGATETSEIKIEQGTNKVETPDQASLGTELSYLIKVHLSLKYKSGFFWRSNSDSLR